LTHGARRAGPWLAATALLVLAEAGVAPLPLNAGEPPGRYAVPNAELYPDGRLPDVYEAVAAAPADAVVLELPLGSPAWDVGAVFYPAVHWRGLVNGYSGGFRQRYFATAAALTRIEATRLGPGPAFGHQAPRTSSFTGRQYLNGGDAAVVQWLEDGGAARKGSFGTDVLYELRR
jgi:hypothetical protein